MSQTVPCPKCGSSVEGGTGLGMVTCPKCGEFILMGEQGEPRGEPAASDDQLVADVFEFSFDATNPEKLNSAGTNSQVKKGESSTQSAIEMTVFVENSDAVPLAPPPSPSADSGGSSVIEHAAPAAAEPSAFRDVVEFANLDQEATGTGGLVYDVVIKGIDTVETRQEIAACLGDRRLKFNANQVLKTIEGGELVLRDLNPVRASVVVSVMKHLSLQISWSSRQLIKGAFILFFVASFFVGSSGYASDWARHEVNLKGYATKIENMEEDIRALLVKKNQNKDPEVRDEILKEIIKKNAELKNTYGEFKKEKEHIRFEHPEQGDTTERKYRHIKLKSLDELEDEAGLQGQLSRLKKKVEETYPGEKSAGDDQKLPSDSVKKSDNK